MDWGLILPTEIWEIIFKYIDDPIELSTLQQVCPRWHAIIEKVLPSWKQICEKNVPVFWFRYAAIKLRRRMKEPRFYEDANDFSPDFWRDLYGSWRQFHSSIEQSQSVKIVNNSLQLPEAEDITCVATNEDLVAYGTTQGNIYFSHVVDWRKPFFIAHHEQAIIGIKFLSPFKSDFVPQFHRAVSICAKNLKYWECITRKEIKIYQNLGGLPNIPFKLLLSRNERIVAMNSYNWYNFSMTEILTWNGQATRKYDLLSSMVDDKLNLLHDLELHTSYFPWELRSSNRTDFHFLSKHIGICLTDDLMAFLIHNVWRIHDLFYGLGSHVRSVVAWDPNCFRAMRHEEKKGDENQEERSLSPNVDASAHLLLGLNSGAVYLFKVGYLSEVKDFDFATAPIRKVIFDNEPIIAVDVLRTNGKKNYIVAATKKMVYIDKTSI